MVFEAAQKNPHYLKALTTLADFLLETGEPEEALKPLIQADKISPLGADRKVTIGKVFLDRGYPDKASPFFLEATRLEPAKNEEIANACLERGEAELATQYLNQSVAAKMKERALTPEETASYIDKYNQAGIKFRKDGEWQKAILAYRSALDVDPTNPAIHFNMGKAYAQGNKNREAHAFFEKALKMNLASEEPDNELSKIIEAEMKSL